MRVVRFCGGRVVTVCIRGAASHTMPNWASELEAAAAHGARLPNGFLCARSELPSISRTIGEEMTDDRGAGSSRATPESDYASWASLDWGLSFGWRVAVRVLSLS